MATCPFRTRASRGARCASDVLHLRQRLVRAAAVVLGAVREEPVDDHADNGEEEDDQAPEELVDWRTVGLEDLDYSKRGQSNMFPSHTTSTS